MSLLQIACTRTMHQANSRARNKGPLLQLTAGSGGLARFESLLQHRLQLLICTAIPRGRSKTHLSSMAVTGHDCTAVLNQQQCGDGACLRCLQANAACHYTLQTALQCHAPKERVAHSQRPHLCTSVQPSARGDR